MGLGPAWYAPPSAETKLDSRADSYDLRGIVYRGVGIRFVARFIDAIVVLFIGIGGSLISGIVLALLVAFHVLAPTIPATPQGLGIVVVAVTFGSAWLSYCSVCEATGDVTVGKWMCALRVRRIDLTPTTLGRAIVRNACFLLDFAFIGPTLILATRERQRLGDKLADTAVVGSTSLPASAIRPAGRACMFGVMAGTAAFALTWGMLELVIR